MLLEINPEIVCALADKARQFHVKVAVDIPEDPLEHGDYSQYQILVDYEDDPIYSEFKRMVQDLEPDQQDILVALMWLGRGDFEVTEWETAKAEAQTHRSVPIYQYLISKPLLADYLEEGLAKLGYSCEE